MERKKYIPIVLLALSSCFKFGQNNKVIFNAYAAGKITNLKVAIDSVEAHFARCIDWLIT